jgi:hypothetical protein
MLSLTRAEATLGKIVNNHEKHGREKRVTNFAFPLQFRCKADKLDEIARGLCASLFRKPEAGDQQELVGETEFTVVNCPDLKPSTLSQQYTGYEMTLTPRGSESDDDEGALFLVDVKLGSFSIQPYEGGMCDVSFTATARIDLETEAVPALRLNEAGDVLVTLTPPTKPQTTDDEEGDDD